MAIALPHFEGTHSPLHPILWLTTGVGLLVVDGSCIILTDGIALLRLLISDPFIAACHHRQRYNIYYIYKYVEILSSHTIKNEKKAPLLYGAL